MAQMKARRLVVAVVGLWSFSPLHGIPLPREMAMVHPINEAHLLERKAARCADHCEWKTARGLLRQAVVELEKAAASTSYAEARKSITLQIRALERRHALFERNERISKHEHYPEAPSEVYALEFQRKDDDCADVSALSPDELATAVRQHPAVEKLVFYIRQQQAQIFGLSSKLRNAEKEINWLKLDQRAVSEAAATPAAE